MRIKESAEQKALVSKCDKENILIICTENSLNFPLNYVMNFLKNYINDRAIITVKKFFIRLISQLTKQRIQMGMKMGYPDLFIPEKKLFIELKRRDGGILSKEQIEMHQQLRNAGYIVQTAHGAKEAWEYING